jgi:hypothetical protein
MPFMVHNDPKYMMKLFLIPYESWTFVLVESLLAAKKALAIFLNLDTIRFLKYI